MTTARDDGTNNAAGGALWYRSLSRTQWKALLAANLGWLFDGYETYALILTVGVALRHLLAPSQYPQIPAYEGVIQSRKFWTLLGFVSPL
jgi:hypothetical protein